MLQPESQHAEARSLGEYVDRLQGSGRYSFTGDEARRALGYSAGAHEAAVRRLKRKGRLVCPRKGFFVVVPVEYQSAGSPPASWFIDELMRCLGRPYYVGLLTAAAIHGAARSTRRVVAPAARPPAARPARGGSPPRSALVRDSERGGLGGEKIPRAHITHWRGSVPWADDAQVEQDLVLSRAVLEIFADAAIANRVALRGGTALHKLLISPPVRYSEDIDLVQRDPGLIGEVLDGLRARLDRWLGKPHRERGPGSARIAYRFSSETMPIRPLRLRIEINTREHFAVLPIQSRRLVVDSPWFRGEAKVAVYHLDELLGTKLRALYQRKKGRDLFDLWFALDRGLLDPEAVVTCFRRYMEHGGTPVSRAEFEANLAGKERDPAFHGDIRPLLAPGVEYDAQVALDLVRRDLVSRLPGDAWQGKASPGP